VCQQRGTIFTFVSMPRVVDRNQEHHMRSRTRTTTAALAAVALLALPAAAGADECVIGELVHDLEPALGPFGPVVHEVEEASCDLLP
jgi:hypothetical protein